MTELRNIEIKNNSFKATLNIFVRSNEFIDETTNKYCLLPNDAVELQVRVIAAHIYHTNISHVHTFLFVNFTKCSSTDENDYILRLTVPEISNDALCFSTSEIWQFIGKIIYHNSDAHFALYAQIDPMRSELQTLESPPPQLPITFATLQDDGELTDFELRGSDGGVAVHRAALAAASPVLRRMLAGDWREAKQGHVDVPDMSVETLRHFKDYIYVNVLPDSGVDDLLLLASRYMMHDLEQHCVRRLVTDLSSENALDMIHFATKHKLTFLLSGLLECIENGKVNVNNISVPDNATE